VTFWMLSGCALHPILTHQYAASPMPGALPAPAVLRAAFSASLGTDSPDQPLPFHDELTSLCHFALTVTGAASYALLLAHVRAAKAGGKENPAGASTASHPWSVFCTGLWRWLGIEPHAGAPAAPANAWEFVLCSRTHTRLSAAAVLHGLAAAVPCHPPPTTPTNAVTDRVAAEVWSLSVGWQVE